MTVISIIYTDASNATVKTTYADGTASFGPYPSNDGPTRAAHEAFIAGGGSVTAYTAPAPTADDVAAERTRRMALGFDYNFGAPRGVHHIQTTEADMKGWDEVTTLANALIASGQPNATINILTGTGPTQVTATEWQSVLLAAAAFRQPLWAKSFTLQAMSPIPADYKNDSYWT